MSCIQGGDYVSRSVFKKPPAKPLPRSHIYSKQPQTNWQAEWILRSHRRNAPHSPTLWCRWAGARVIFQTTWHIGRSLSHIFIPHNVNEIVSCCVCNTQNARWSTNLKKKYITKDHRAQLSKTLTFTLYTYLLTPWCRVLLEKLTGLQLVKKFPTFYGTQRFITALTSARNLSLSWASPIQSPYPHPTSWRSILILSTHLRLGLPSGFFPSGFPIKTLYTPSPHPYAPQSS